MWSRKNSIRTLFLQGCVQLMALAFLISCSNPLGGNTTSQPGFLSGPGSGSSSLGLTDNSFSLFNLGTATGTVWDGTNSYLRLDHGGTATDLELDASWTPAWPKTVGYWKLNEGAGSPTVADSSFQATNTGNVQSGVTLGGVGAFNTAASFNGSSGYISVPNSSSLQISSGNSISIAAWINPTSLPSYAVIAAKGRTLSNGDPQNYVFGIRSGKLTFYFSSGGGGTQPLYQTAPIIQANVWQHVAVTYTFGSASSIKFYLNGVLYSGSWAVGTGNEVVDNSSSPLWIGATASGVEYMPGKIDELAIWNTLLLNTTISTIYQHQVSKYAGTFQSRVIDSQTANSTWSTFAWTPTLPFYKELSDNAVSESTAAYPSLSSSTLMSGIGGLWHFDETSLGSAPAGTDFADRSGSSNHAQQAGGVVLNPNGKFAGSVSLNGSSSISVPNSSSLSYPSSNITVSVWVNPSAASSNNRIKNAGFESGPGVGWTLGAILGAGMGIQSGAPPDGGVVPTGIVGSYYMGCNDGDEGYGQSDAFFLPPGVDHLDFLRAGGAGSPSGVFVKKASDNSILCSAYNSAATDTFFDATCTGLSAYSGQKVYIYVIDQTNGGWGKVYVDSFNLQNSSNANLFTSGVILDQSTNGGGFQLELDSNLNPIVYTPGLSGGALLSSVSLTAGVWSHVVFTYDGTTESLYVNGALAGSVTATGTLTTTASLKIGSTLNSTSYFTGSVDELSIWSRSLSSAETLQLYRRGVNRARYQVRSCPDSTCSTNPIWLGPDGTNQTYFTEMNNNAVPSAAADLSTSDVVQAASPLMTYANFGGLLIPSNRYFQYRTIMESDDVGTGCNYSGTPTWCSPELKSVTTGP